MEVFAFIPARWGSTRLIGKPLKDIKGRPMVEWVYERALLAKTVNKVFVATDDKRIFNRVLSFGGNAVMTSKACSTGSERVLEAVKKTGLNAGIAVNVQGDEPLIEPSIIDAIVRAMLKDPQIALATAKTRIFNEEEFLNPNVVKVVTDKKGNALYFSRSPVPYSKGKFSGNVFKHIGIYAYRTRVLVRLAQMKPAPLEKREGLEQLRALENGIKIKVLETGYNPVSVDTPEDLERVRGMV